MKQATKFLPFALVTGFVFAPIAHAALFDFANIANTEGERGFVTFNRTVDSIGLKATGTSAGDLDGTPDYYAYLDASDDGLPGGLGVCKALTGNKKCKDAADDDVETQELLNLLFDTEVTIDNIWFRTFEHTTTFDPTAEFMLSIDGGLFASYSLSHLFSVPLTGTSFSFMVGTPPNGEDFYIEKLNATLANVPEPATLSLMALGLAGLAWRRRFGQAE